MGALVYTIPLGEGRLNVDKDEINPGYMLVPRDVFEHNKVYVVRNNEGIDLYYSSIRVRESDYGLYLILLSDAQANELKRKEDSDIFIYHPDHPLYENNY